MSVPAPSPRPFLVKPVLRVFARQLQKYRGLVWFIGLATVITEAISSVALPYVGKLLFDALAKTRPEVAAIDPLNHIIFLFIGASFCVWLLSRFLNHAIVYLQSYVMADLEQTSFSYLLGHSYQFFQDSFSGSLVRRITRISRSFEEIADNIQQKMIPIIVAFIGILVVLFRRSLLVGSLILGWILLMLVYNYFYTRWKIKHDVARAAQDSRCTGFLSDALSNVLTIKLFTGSQRENKTFETESNALRDMRYFAWKTHLYNHSFQGFVLIVLQAIVLLFGIRAWRHGQLSAGDLVLFQSYFTILNNSVLNFSRMIRSLYSAFADATEMVEILDQPYAIKDVRGAKNLLVTKAAVQFDHVRFSYGDRAVLNDFSLLIKPGEKVALVGASGAGKSTIIKLLFRFYDVSDGAIFIDKQNIKKVTQESLRRQIALVPQEPVLFHRTLRENIQYSRPEATEAQVMEAARLAHCDEFIQHFQQTYNTYVGERGVKLSGGERQRVAIARAILKNAPILVLDEATSSLDSESERLIQDALRTLMRGKTAIVIAHRLSTVMSMDRIIVMEHGSVVDVGSHDDLVRREGIYRKLWDIQVGGFMPDDA